MTKDADTILKLLKKTKKSLDAEVRKREATDYDLGYDSTLNTIIKKLEKNRFLVKDLICEKEFSDSLYSDEYKDGVKDCISFYKAVVSFVDKVENPL